MCDCASSVGTGSTSADTQYFVNEDMGVYLGVFEDGGAAAYEICETGGECHAYGDVNDGMVARRRRRLLQTREEAVGKLTVILGKTLKAAADGARSLASSPVKGFYRR